MQTPNAKRNFSSDDPAWALLAEFSLSDFLDGSAAGSLFQTLRELGMSPECIENIVRTLAGFAKEALMRGKQGRLECPGRIRIFCRKRMIHDARAAKTSRSSRTGQGQQQKQMVPDSGAGRIGGWGYFMIERGENLPPDSSTIPHNFVDLYLYREGQ
jgi:hypothetical protein